MLECTKPYIRPAYVSLYGFLVSDFPVTEVIIIGNSLVPRKQEAMVPINDVRTEGKQFKFS